jgi:hypothetical protein
LGSVYEIKLKRPANLFLIYLSAFSTRSYLHPAEFNMFFSNSLQAFSAFSKPKPARKNGERSIKMRLELLEDRIVPASFSEFVDPHPAPGNQFGATVLPLSTGNVVIASPHDNAGGTDAGAVYLFNGGTGALINTLTGSHAGDEVGGGILTP